MKRQTVALALIGALVFTGITAGGYLTISGLVSGPGMIAAPDGPGIVLEGETTMNLSDPPDPGTLTLRTSDGNATFASSGRSNATIHVDDLDGSWTNLSNLDVQNALTVDAEGMPQFTVGGDADSVAVPATVATDDGAIDFAYSGPDGTTSRVTLSGVSADTTIAAVDADSSAVLDVATSDGAGTITFDQLDNSAHDVVLQTQAGAPTTSNLTPDGTSKPWSNATLSVDVADPNMPDESLDVTFYVDGSSVATQTVSSNTTVSTSVSGLSEGSHSWHVDVTDSYGATTTSATATWTVDHYDPTVTSATPTGNISVRPDALEVNVEDRDFGLDGDSLSISFDFDGSSIGTDSIDANGTASASLDSMTVAGGEHSWSATITDDYGQTTTRSYNFSTPTELSIYNESDPNQQLGNVTAELQFYFSDGGPAEVYNRSVTDGSINMTGLPVERPFVVTAGAPDYYDRRIFVPSLYETQKIYMLPINETVTQTTFDIQDYSGDYSQDSSVLTVQRALNGSWQTVLGDYFGANGQFPATLAYNERHRLTIRNTATGNSKILGSYTPYASGEQTVTIAPNGTIDLLGPGIALSISPGTQQLPGDDGVPISATLSPGSETTIANWSVDVYYDTASGGNVSLASESFQSDGGTYEPTLDLSGRDPGDVVVIIAYNTTGGKSDTLIRSYSVQTIQQSTFTLLDGLSGFVGLIVPANQEAFSGLLAIVLSIVLPAAIATQLRLPSEILGLTVIGFFAAFAILGWLSYNVLFVGLVAWGSLAYLRRRY